MNIATTPLVTAELLSIGTELAIGQTVDTNGAWLAQQLAAQGVLCRRHITVADEREDIAEAIRMAAARADVVLITGGLGPTADDLTRFALADCLGCELQFDAASFAHIEAFFHSRNRAMHESNRVQAMIPARAHAIENPRGTAPGIEAKLGRAHVYCMPGVPGEMKAMFERSVSPMLPAAAGGAVIHQRVIHTFGMSESELGHSIADLMARGRNPTVGTSASELIISVRINAHGSSADEARRLAEADADEVRQRLGVVVFGEGDSTLADAVGKLLIERRATVATAESCTGGLIAGRLTDVPGSSAYFIQALVTYSNEAKQRLLGIPAELIDAHGAVSEPVARAMAEHCRRLAGTDYALSATGIAGPTGGTATKPVGLVYVGLASAAEVVVRELRLGENLSRAEIRDRTSKAALNLLRLRLMK